MFIFAPPQGNFSEVRFLNLLERNEIFAAFEYFKLYYANPNKRLKIDINTIICGSTVFSHTISAFETTNDYYNKPVFREMIWFMIKHAEADINQYDSLYKTTYFTRLCGCSLTDNFLKLLVSKDPWFNPHEKLSGTEFRSTPLQKLISHFDVNLIKIACDAGANLSSTVVGLPKNTSLVEYAINIATKSNYFQQSDLIELLCEVILTLHHFGAYIDQNCTDLIHAEIENSVDSDMLQGLLYILSSDQPKFGI